MILQTFTYFIKKKLLKDVRRFKKMLNFAGEFNPFIDKN